MAQSKTISYMAQSKTISYDDTRDVSIRILEYLIDNKYITEFENENEYEWDFHIQDVIQGEINDVLGLDIDDNFETKIEWKWTI